MNTMPGREGERRVAAPAVSVIIPVYNCGDYVGETLRSVFEQTFTDYEVIVVNDGSEDVERLEQALAPYRDRIVYFEQENKGASAARNRAILAARAELLAFLDADDLYEPEYLAVQVGMMRADPTIDVLYPDALVIGDGSGTGRRFMELSPSEGEVCFESLVSETCVVLAQSTARRDAIARAGMFDESLPRNVDFDLWLRVAKTGGRIAYHRRRLVRYRRRAGSLSSNSARMCRGAIRVLDKMERDWALLPSEQEAIEEARHRFRARALHHEGKRDFLRGECAQAARKLREANRYLRSRRLAFAVTALRTAPRLVRGLYRLQERWLARAPAKGAEKEIASAGPRGGGSR